MADVEKFWEGILDWYSKNSRDYPWRKTINPFHVLIAEFLLQQTHVRKVQEVYERFIDEYPAPAYLAQAQLFKVERIIKPLGLSYRANRLIKCAEIICSEFGGRVPNSSEQLKKLPGVGSYISDAVLCYAYGKPTIPIDTNVIRVFCRYFGLKSDKSRPRTDTVLAECIKGFYQFENTRIPNLAVLDFAGTVCTAKKPNCDQCNASAECFYRKSI